MEVSLRQKRESLELCQKLIPMMTEKEIRQIGIALNQTVERLLKEGKVTIEQG